MIAQAPVSAQFYGAARSDFVGSGARAVLRRSDRTSISPQGDSYFVDTRLYFSPACGNALLSAHSGIAEFTFFA